MIFILHSHDCQEVRVYDSLGLRHGLTLDTVTPGTVVFPRFCAIPFGNFLEQGVQEFGAHLSNSWAQHCYISDTTAWADLPHMIPVYQEEDIPRLPEGRYFIKGETNALKNEWNKYCYAPTVSDVPGIVANNKAHPLMADQKIIIKPFLDFKKYGVQDSGMPVVNEWRYFCYHGEIVASGFYWSQQVQKFNFTPDSTGAEDVVCDVLGSIGNKADFVAIDVAQLINGDWVLVELNDGNMAGLCGTDPMTLWAALTDH